VNPDRPHGHGEKRIEARGQTFPADNQPAVRALEPSQRPLGLVAGHILLDRTAARLFGFPYPFGDLGADPTSAEALAQVFGVLAFLRRQHREPFARAASFIWADVQSIQQRDDLGPLLTMCGRGTRGQRHTGAVREAMDEEALAFPALRDALTAACARGKRNQPRRHTATESSRVPRPVRVSVLAWRPASHRLATVAASDARYSWTPIGARAGGHTSGSR
jgi:hypothetical protein